MPESSATGLTVRIAQAIALAHGHTWGGTVLPPQERYTAAEIDMLTREQGDGPGVMGWGITCPDIGEGGAISHTTGTGRLWWSVEDWTDRDSPVFAGEWAKVTLEFSRPWGTFARVAFQPGNAPHATVDSRVNRDSCPFFRRHEDEVAVATRLVGEAIARATGWTVGPADLSDLAAAATDEAEWLDREIERLRRRRDSLVEA